MTRIDEIAVRELELAQARRWVAIAEMEQRIDALVKLRDKFTELELRVEVLTTRLAELKKREKPEW